MRERGLSVDRVTVFGWVRRYAPEINKRMRPHLKMSGTPYRLDGTSVKVGGGWKDLYRAVSPGMHGRVYAERRARRSRGKTFLQEADEG